MSKFLTALVIAVAVGAIVLERRAARRLNDQEDMLTMLERLTGKEPAWWTEAGPSRDWPI